MGYLHWGYPIQRIVEFWCKECHGAFRQPDDDQNRLCLNCRYPITNEGSQ